MNIFIDTAVKGCNVALFDDTHIHGTITEPIERGHAETLVPLIEKALRDAGKTPQDIENIYVTIGPGSFTGLRVGLTVAQFMGFSLSKSVHGITTFQAFSCGVESDQNQTIVIETKRSDFYVQTMDKNHKPLTETQSLPSSDIQIDGIITGDAVERFISEMGYEGESVVQSMIDCKAVIEVIQSGTLDFHKPEAFYIRDADVSQPKAKKI